MRIGVSSWISFRISGDTRPAVAGLGENGALLEFDAHRSKLLSSFEPPIGGLPKMCFNLFSTICMAAFSASDRPADSGHDHVLLPLVGPVDTLPSLQGVTVLISAVWYTGRLVVQSSWPSPRSAVRT